MIVFRCDVCNRDQERAADLTSSNVVVKMGSVLVVNLPIVDRCVSCQAAMLESLRTVAQSLDDTRRNMGREPITPMDLSEELAEAEGDSVLLKATGPWPTEGSK